MSGPEDTNADTPILVSADHNGEGLSHIETTYVTESGETYAEQGWVLSDQVEEFTNDTFEEFTNDTYGY